MKTIKPHLQPLPIGEELGDVIRRAKLQLANWGNLSNGPGREFKPVSVDLLVTVNVTEGRNLADALAQCMDLTEHSMVLSHHRRLVAITVIHALDEINRLRAALREGG